MHGLSKNGRRQLARDLGNFLRLYRRKAQKGVEPNDRLYDHQVERILQRLKPEELDTLLNGEAEERMNFSNEEAAHDS
jgi:hypothetical protein